MLLSRSSRKLDIACVMVGVINYLFRSIILSITVISDSSIWQSSWRFKWSIYELSLNYLIAFWLVLIGISVMLRTKLIIIVVPLSKIIRGCRLNVMHIFFLDFNDSSFFKWFNTILMDITKNQEFVRNVQVSRISVVHNILYQILVLGNKNTSLLYVYFYLLKCWIFFWSYRTKKLRFTMKR